MQVIEVLSENLKHQFKVTASASELQKRFELRLQRIGEKVRIPGFRPGKTPKNILVQRYGSDCWKEVSHSILQETLEQIRRDHKFKSALDPMIDITCFEEGKDFECTVTLEVLPEIDIKDFKEIALEKLIVHIDDQDVEARLKQLHAGHTKYQEPAVLRSAQKGDLVSVKWSGSLEDDQRMELPETYQILLGPEKDDSLFLPVVKALYGKKTGDVFEVDVTFSSEKNVKELAGKKAKIKVEIQKLEEPITFELDDAFAKEFKAENLEELRKSIRSSVEYESQKVARLYLKRHLLDILNSEYNFDLPPSLVENEFEAIWNHLQKELTEARSTGELEEDEDQPEENLKAEYQEIAKRRVRLGLLVSTLAERYKLQLKEEEIRMAIFREALRYSEQADEVIKYYTNNKAALQSLIAPLMEDKVIDFITNRSTLTERTVDFPSLKKIVRGVIPTPYDDEEEEEGDREAKEIKTSKEASK